MSELSLTPSGPGSGEDSRCLSPEVEHLYDDGVVSLIEADRLPDSGELWEGAGILPGSAELIIFDPLELLELSRLLAEADVTSDLTPEQEATIERLVDHGFNYEGARQKVLRA